MGQNDVRCERYQFGRVPTNFGGIGCGPVGVDPHVAANGPSQLAAQASEGVELSASAKAKRSRRSRLRRGSL